MHRPQARIRSIATALLLTLALALGLVQGAFAQDPGADQYAPTAPSADGPTLSDPGPATPKSSHPGSSATQPQGGGSTQPKGGGPSTAPSGSGVGAAQTSAERPGIPLATPRAEVGKLPSQERSRNGDQRTVAGFAAGAREQVAAADDQSGSALLRDDQGKGGLGVLFWILIGAAVIWALLSAARGRRAPSQSTGSAREQSRVARTPPEGSNSV